MIEQINEFFKYLVEKKYRDIAVFDLSKEDKSFDYGIIATTTNISTNKKLALMLMQSLGIEMFPEGFNKGEWIVFDLGKIVFHSFIPESRERYNLDKLWQSKKITLTV